MDPDAIAQAVWEYETRTLASGTPDPPASRAEEIAEGVWEYVTRTLTTVPQGTGRVVNLTARDRSITLLPARDRSIVSLTARAKD